MATQTYSVQRVLQDGINGPLMLQISGNLRVMHDTHTVTAADNPYVIDFPKLPPGRILVLSYLSRLNSSDMPASVDLNLGYRAFRNPNGTLTAEDNDFWLADVDSGGGAINATFSAVTGFVAANGAVILDTVDGLVPFVTLDAAATLIGDTVTVTLVYAMIN